MWHDLGKFSRPFVFYYGLKKYNLKNFYLRKSKVLGFFFRQYKSKLLLRPEGFLWVLDYRAKYTKIFSEKHQAIMNLPKRYISAHKIC